MSGINLRNLKRDFSQLNYRPNVCDPNLIKELKNILETTGLAEEYDTVLSNLNVHSLVDIIKRVCDVCYSNTCNEETATAVFTFLAKIYIEHCVNDAVKCTLTKCLKSCPEKWASKLTTAIVHQFVINLETVKDFCKTEYLLKTLNDCCEQFPNVVLNCIQKVVIFFIACLDKLFFELIEEKTPAQKISAIRCAHESSRFFLTAYRKNIFPKTAFLTNALNECFMDLIDTNQLPMETLFNCCLSVAYLFRHDVSAFTCWNICLEKLLNRPDLTKLGFCMAALNVCTDKDLKLKKITEETVYGEIYNNIMNASCRNLNDSCILISSSRVLFTFSKRLCIDGEIILEKRQLDELIAFLWLAMDHFLDSVRHMARDTMINIIKIEDNYILNEILERLSVCDINSKAFFIILTILSDKVHFKSVIKTLPKIVDILIQLMNTNNSAVIIFINLMSNHYSIIDNKLWFDYWLRPLFHNANLVDVKNFEQIITEAVKLTPDVSKYIYDLSNKSELSLQIYLIWFTIEKRLCLNHNHKDWIDKTKFEIIKKALYNNNENIRFIAVNLILNCQKKTQLFTEIELELMKHFIMYNIKNEKASVKQTHMSFVIKLLLRMKKSQFSCTVKNDECLNSTVTKYYTDFQHWFSNFCFYNLFSDATFSRRNFSLESLRCIQTYWSPTDIIGLNKLENISLLLNCLWDTYEQNKIIAKGILTHKNQDLIKLDNTVIENMLKTSKILASSTKPPDSITAGYLLEVVIMLHQNSNHEDYTFVIIMDLMNDLENEIKLAEESLTLASAKGPMYGLIHCIRHLLNTLDWQTLNLKNNWTDFIKNISTICLKCLQLISVVINDSSPEGIVPMDDSCQNNYDVTSQMVLLCSWRTAKESSLLLGDIVNMIAAQKSEFNNSLITKICSCLTLLLSETKHRGAFEQIYIAYTKVCSLMWRSPTLYKIPHEYLENVLTEIKTGLRETFCVTRRSAGMPFIIQSLLCTNHDKRKIVDYTMETLISICENKNITENLEVGVIHAQNVLRALFRCSDLGDLVGPFVSRAIKISIILFNSSSWSIRNSSTILLSALMNRVFGVPRSSTMLCWKNRMTGREFFRRYPDLYDTFLNEFKKFSPIDLRPSLYPTLLILDRLYPSNNEATDDVFPLAVYIPFIFKCAQSPIMKTRMLAATSIAHQVTQNNLVDHLHITFNELINKNLKENTKHGLLLQVFSLVENLPKLMPKDLNKLVTLTEDLLTKYDKFSNCSYVVQEVLLRCITYLWIQLDDLQYNSVKYIYVSTLKSIMNLDQFTIGQSKYLESAILFLFSVCVKAKTDFSVFLYKVVKNKIKCQKIFEILNAILSEEPVECVFLSKLMCIKYWDTKTLKYQIIKNDGFITLFCSQCNAVDSLVHMRFWVLSNFPSALHTYFKTYTRIDYFILKLNHYRSDPEIAHGLLCVNGYICNQESLEQSLIVNLTQCFENIYYAQRSDDCKIASVDIIVNNYELMIKNSVIDIKTFLKLWTLILHYSEDDNEEVRNHVWCLVNKDTNSSKSFELLFNKFEEYFNQYPSAILLALICWSYLDIKLPQNRPKEQVFDGGDTSEFGEHTIRQRLALDTITRLMNSNPQSMDLKIYKKLNEWIIEEWTYDLDFKPTIYDLNSIGNFMAYAKEFYTKTTVNPLKISLC